MSDTRLGETETGPLVDGNRGRTSEGQGGVGAESNPLEVEPRTALGRWLESRTGLLGAVHVTFDPPVPRSARWRYALGASLVAALAVEVFTGLLLMMTYCPSATSAWGSTFYIDKVLTAGWFLRGMHSFAGHAMFIGAGMHLASVVASGVYRKPREMNWWMGLALIGLVIAFILTGNALVWDQDGYWAWHVETGIAGGMPVIGALLQRLAIGGTELGTATLGRLYALHAGLLPLLTIALLAGHILLARRHLLHPRGEVRVAVEAAWPRQVYFNTLATAFALGVVALLVILNNGVSLEAPADPASQYPARPAWFFLWLFELRKYFLGPREIIATAVIPASVAAVMILIPFLDRVFPTRFAHFLACAFTFVVLGGICVLTARSVWVDAHDTDYLEGTRTWDAARDRAVALAFRGIPPDGAPALLSRDPLYHGHALLQAKCLGCHALGEEKPEQIKAPDLKDYGTRAWVRGLLENPGAPEFFGKVPSCQGMVEWKSSSKLDAKQLDAVADFVASFAAIPQDLSPQEWLNTKAVSEHPGLELFTKECGTCHAVEGLTEGGKQDAPALFGWGSPWWTARLLRKPSAPDLYGYLEPDKQMPGFVGQLTENDEQTIIRYLRNDYLGAPSQKPPDPPESARAPRGPDTSSPTR